MKKTKILLASAAMVLTLGAFTSCGKKYKPVDDEVLEACKEQLALDQENPVYGNMYIPQEVDIEGVKVTWKSSKPYVISDTKIGQKEPGVVNRTSTDEEVTMTAIIEQDGKRSTFDQQVTVAKLEKEIKDEDYKGYLFGHFISEDGKQVGNQKVALGEQMYFAFADVDKGLHFKDLSTRNNPILSSTVGERGIRDPFMIRSPEGDRFFIVATDLSVYTRGGWGANTNDKFSKTGSDSLTLWESRDLINWSESRSIKVAPDHAGMAWAPEMIWHEESGQYVILFSSCLVNDARTEKTEQDAIYYVTTRDFVHISEAKLLIDNQKLSECKSCHSKNLNKNPSNYKELVCQDCGAKSEIRISLDASLTRVDDTYYYAIKDGDNNVSGGGILISKTTDLFNKDAWEKVMHLADTGLKMPDNKTKPSNQNLEGPEWFIYNRNDREDPDSVEIGLMGDQYMNQGAGYLPFATTNIEDKGSWRRLEAGASKDYSWDSLTKRHGTMIRLTEEECIRIRTKYNLSY